MFERPMLFLSVIFLEFYALIIVVALLDEFVLAIASSTQDGIVALFLLFAVIQVNAGSLNQSRPQHIANMAIRARQDVNGSPRDFSLNIFWMRHCLAGMTRAGRDRSGGHFTDILLSEFNRTPKTSPSPPESPTLRKMLAGIEMQMAWELAWLRSGQQDPSSIKFCDAVARYRDDSPPAVGDLAALIVKQYLGLSPEVKTRLEDEEEKHRKAKTLWRATRGELMRLIVAALPGILYVVAILMGWQLPER